MLSLVQLANRREWVESKTRDEKPEMIADILIYGIFADSFFFLNLATFLFYIDQLI